MFQFVSMFIFLICSRAHSMQPNKQMALVNEKVPKRLRKNKQRDRNKICNKCTYLYS